MSAVQLKYVLPGLPKHKVEAFRFDQTPDQTGRLKLIADASDLFPQKLHDRVWRDSEDRGFWCVGKTTAVLFTLSEEMRSGDGDIDGWMYVSYNGDLRGCHYTCTIYND